MQVLKKITIIVNTRVNSIKNVDLDEQVSLTKGAIMENRSSGGWKFFALLFGALLAGIAALYVYKQHNPDYDPWEQPWENSSSPINLGVEKENKEEAVEAKPVEV